MYNILILLPKIPTRSFFLWGQRQVGKSTLLQKLYPDAYRIDLLQSDTFALFTQRPARLREVGSRDQLTVIDEVQKIPELLDEVHWCIENQGRVFALCGSSARRLKRGHANLLGGRALRYELYGVSAQELEQNFDLLRILNRGYLPSIYDCDDRLVLPKQVAF